MSNEINGRDDITFGNCAFKPHRSELATFFTEYLSTKKDGFVFNLDGDWGTGKSFFIKAWINQIKDKHPVCYIDSWLTDFSDNPLIVIIHSILNSLNEEQKKVIGFDPETETKFLESALSFIRSSSALSQPILKIFSPELWAMAKGTDKLSEILQDVMKNKKTDYEDFKESISGLEKFKKELKIIVETITKSGRGELSTPLFIFVDELDRCRPTYAIQVLETIKHLFDCEDIVFVIATNKRELVKSISHVYGVDFSSEEYLSRFFDRSASLPSPNIRQYLMLKKVDERLVDFTDSAYKPVRDQVLQISFVFDVFSISLRQGDKLLEQLYSVLSFLSGRERSFSINVVILLICIKEKYPEIFDDKSLNFHSLSMKLNDLGNKLNGNVECKIARHDVNFRTFLNDSLYAEGLYENYVKATGVASGDAAQIYSDYIHENVNERGRGDIRKSFDHRDTVDFMCYVDLKGVIDMANSIS